MNTVRPLSAEEVARLEAFRRAAHRAHDIIDRFWNVQFRVIVGAPAPDSPPTGLPDDTFLALLTAVRLTYLKKEPAHFARTVKTLRRVLPQDFGEALDVISENWRSAAFDGAGFGSPTVSMTFAEALDTLFNGIVFHQDPDHRERAALLAEMSPLSDVAIQPSIFFLGRAMIQLDSLVAHALNQPRLSRGPVIAPKAAP